MATSPKLTGRAFILLGIVLLILLMVAMPLRGLVRERRDVAEISQAIEAQKTAIKDLRNQRERLKDPAYLQSLARD